MQLPKPKMLSSAKRQLVTTFYGLDRTDLCGEDTSDGENYFSDMKNGGSDSFPFAASRSGRGITKLLDNPANGLLGTDKLAYVDGQKLIYDGREVLTDLIDGEKRLVAFGANILIYPDQKYYNTVTGESGAMETAETVSGSETILTKNFKYKASDSRISTDADGNVYISVNYIMGRGGFTLKSALCRTAKDSVYGPTPYTDGEAATEDSFTKFLRIRIQNGTIEYISSATTVHFSETDMGFRTYKLENIVWRRCPLKP